MYEICHRKPIVDSPVAKIPHKMQQVSFKRAFQTVLWHTCYDYRAESVTGVLSIGCGSFQRDEGDFRTDADAGWEDGLAEAGVYIKVSGAFSRVAARHGR